MQKKHRFRLLISYNGFKYYGWQKQKQLSTIQAQIEEAIKQVLQEKVTVVGSGRTDTGTHALGQNAHFDISKPLPAGLHLQKALNAFLVPKDICIRQAWKAPPDFHALHSAINKQYAYFILHRPWPCVFRKNLIYWYPYLMKLDLLQSLSQKIKGRHDFKSFQSSGSPVKSTTRTISSAHWKKIKQHTFVFHIQGEGFLKQMVRNLVGTQLALLREDKPIKKLDEVFSAKDRKAAYATAPASGLYLYKVSYPPELDRKCQKI